MVSRRHEAVLVHEPDAVVVGGAPDAGVGGHRRRRARGPPRTRPAPGTLGSPVTSKAIWKPSMSSPVIRRVTKSRNSGAADHSARRLLDVAVGEDEPARHRLQRVHRGVGVLDGLQPVRPVHRGGDAGVDRLDGGEQVAGVDVLRAEVLAVLQVVPDEVLGQRPVGAVAAHRGLPHVPVGVDHPGHHDATGRVDLHRALGHVEAGPTAAIRSSGDRTSAPVSTVLASSMASTVRAAQHHRRPRTLLSHLDLLDRTADCGRMSAVRSLVDV